jgi:hypothetical protein
VGVAIGDKNRQKFKERIDGGEYDGQYGDTTEA